MEDKQDNQNSTHPQSYNFNNQNSYGHNQVAGGYTYSQYYPNAYTNNFAMNYTNNYQNYTYNTCNIPANNVHFQHNVHNHTTSPQPQSNANTDPTLTPHFWDDCEYITYDEGADSCSMCGEEVSEGGDGWVDGNGEGLSKLE